MLAVVAANELQEQLPAAEAVEDGVGVIDDLPLGLPDEVPLQPVAAEQFREQLVAVVLGVHRLVPSRRVRPRCRR